MTSTLQRRVEALEQAASSAGGGGGCDRCHGTLLVVSDAITGEFHSSRWNGESLGEADLEERQTETRCPKCGRSIDPDEGTVIRVGGRRS